MLKLSKEFLTEIQIHGEEAYSEECCGAMLGNVNYDTMEKSVTKLVKIENSSSENRHRRFEVTDKDYQELEAQAKDSGLTLLGFYHTHPDCPSVPSETDLAYAWPFFSYIILSVNNRKADTINSYVLDLDSNAFKEEQLQIEE